MSTANKNVILVGFMGSGKTTVGKRLAHALGWTFVDSDHAIEAHEGMAVRDIFQSEGEAYFRQAETETLRRLLSSENQVIATGGGAVLKEENRKLMLEGGLVVALKASEATVVKRVRGDESRPLLQGDVEERVRSLMLARKTAYDFAPVQIDTDGRSVEEIVKLIAEKTANAV